MNKLIYFFILLLSVLLTSCVVGPDYKRPCAQVPAKFKEAPKGWKMAEPHDGFDRGRWWKIFHDPQLNALECKLNITNQNIAMAAAQFEQAVQLVNEARASYFPSVSVAPSITRQRQVTSTGGSSTFVAIPTTTSSGVSTLTRSSSVTTFHTLTINGSWEPDIWGSVHRTVEASATAAQASAALLALTRLSAQASLAQTYFELRGVDRDQQLLNSTMNDYRKTLQLTIYRYKSGVASQLDVTQARNQLEVAQAQAIALGITRAQYEHAIAVLIGEPPANFSIPSQHYAVSIPRIPLDIPSSLLERRPDIAQAERLMAQANAQIGVAIAAYFPAFTLSGTTTNTYTGSLLKWFSIPTTAWSIGGQLSELVLDGGLRAATVAAARDNYRATVASYRQIVLAAFQDTEDNLVSVRILKSQQAVLKKAADDARLALKLTLNQYKSGTVAYSSVVTAQIAAYTAEKNAIDVKYLQMSSAVGLIKSLGGGWDVAEIPQIS